jgi:hypothetical protein
MNRTIKWLFFMFLLNGLFSTVGRAQTINAASCNSSDVQAALNSVAADGTTINIPAGTCTWTTSVNYSQVFSTTVMGQTTVSGTCGPGGSCTATDSTIIVDGINRSSGDPALINISTASGKSFRLSGVTFNWGGGNSTFNGSIRIVGKSQSVRFDHNHVNRIQAVGMVFSGWTYGVVDHNVFDAPSVGTWNGIKFNAEGWNNETAGNGDNSWADSTTFGSNRAMFAENNAFNNPSGISIGAANDCLHGGRYVWRYNIMNGVDLQTHPTGSAGRARGCRTTEIYGNSATGSGRFNFMFLSSGTSLIWNNTTGSVYANFVTIHSMRRNNTTYTQSATPNGWGYCGTSFTGTGSGWDRNSNTSTGYPCLDQPGQGQGSLITRDFPNAIDSATGTIAWPNDASEPVYEWLNSSSATTHWSNYAPDALLANADYYLYTTSFNGTSGVGSGLLSARPSTCTPKVAYWASDTTTLYQCTATNTWTVYYTPYTYPHPLVTGGPGKPAPPSGLTAAVQ